MKKIRLFSVFSFVLLAVLFLASCSIGGAKAGLVDANTITYDGKVFNWADAQNAATYEVQIGEGTAVTVASPTYNYTAKKGDDVVSITIRAVNAKGKASEEAANKSFNRLATITEIRFDEDGNAEWDSVDGASEYIIKLNGKESKSTSTSISREEFTVDKENTLQVKPSSNTGFADFSATVKKTYLAAPTDIKYDGATISWKGSSKAVGGYEVFVNGASIGTTYSTQMVYDSMNDSFSVTVQALGDQTTSKSTFSSAETEPSNYYYLETVTDLKIDNGKLVWSPVEYATSYELKVDNSVQTVTKTEIDIQPGQSHSYSVKPIVTDGGHYFSSYCEELVGRVLKAPQIQWDNKVNLDEGIAAQAIYWTNDGIEKAGYNLLITLKADGQTTTVVEQFIGKDMLTYEYGFGEVGEYTVTLQNKAVPNGTDYDSAYSQEITVIRLAAPALKSIVSNPDNQLVGFDINLDTTGCSAASGFKLTQEGVENPNVRYDKDQIKVLTVSGVTDDDEHTLTYKVQSVGVAAKTVGGKTTVILNSRKDKSLSVSVTVLAAPTNIQFQGFDATWTPVNKCKGYSVSIGSEPVNQATYSLSQLAIGPADFYVIARGDGASVLASKQSQTHKVVRLARPTQVSVDLVNEQYKMTWQGVPNAASYNVYFNGNKEPVKAEGSLAVDQYLTTTGLTIDMIAVGKGYDNDDNRTYYIDSPNMSEPIKMFLLEAPKFAEQKVRNGVLLWNAPANDNFEEHTPTYIVYNVTGDYKYDGVVRSAGFDLAKNDVKPGTLTFTVRAVGDGKTYITSRLDNNVPNTYATFQYLETPEIRREGNAYVWDSIAGATGYSLRIGDKTPISLSAGTTSWEIDLQYFQTLADTTVTLIAKGDDGYTIVDSKPFTMTQKVSKDNKPLDNSFTISYTDPNGNPLTEFAANGHFKIEINPSASHSNSYTISAGGTETVLKATDGNVFYYQATTPNSYKFKYRGNGGQFDEQGVLYIQSDYSIEKTAAILGTPGGIERTPSQLTWSPVNNSSYLDHYQVTVVAGGQTYEFNAYKTPALTKAQLGFDPLTITDAYVQAIAVSGSVNSNSGHGNWIVQ